MKNHEHLIPQGDLASCESEPIHIPGTIQPNGFLLASQGIDAPLSHVSENARTLLGKGARASLGRSWAEVLGEDTATLLRMVLGDPSTARPISFVSHWLHSPDAEPVELIAHIHLGVVIVEAEYPVYAGDLSASSLSHELAPLLTRLGAAATVDALCELVTNEARRLTQFDRVHVYQFDEEWNGTVVAESRNNVLPSIIRHRFPATDIPKQARDLYHINHIRLIASNDYVPVRILAASAELPALDLSMSTLRGISPIHLEYMRNMGTGCSMSTSIMRDGKLWGLLSCHARDPRRLSFSSRSACDLLGQIFSLQLSAREHAEQLALEVELRKTLSQMLAKMTAVEDFATALTDAEMLALTGAHGAAIVRGEEVISFGIAPPSNFILALRDWVAPRCSDDVFQTDRLSLLYPDIGNFAHVCGGLLAVSISPVDRTYTLWFRAEQVQTVLWGGDPHKSTKAVNGDVRIHPRKSFETWKETVSGSSTHWQPAEVEVAMAFRRIVIDIVLKNAAANARLLVEVQRMNKELEAFSYTVSHDLRAPFRHVRGYAELLQMDKSSQLDEDGRYLLTKILKSTAYAGDLVDTLLAFSRMNLTPLSTQLVDLAELVERAQSHAMTQAGPRSIEWKISTLPEVLADNNLLLLALQNLFDNAVKYTSKCNHAVIEVSAEETDNQWIISVKDNGAGFDMRYADKLFGVFQRLHTSDQFAGLGIGLASVRRIIERHGGHVWAEGQPDKGATFHFALPRVFPNSETPSSSSHAQAHSSR